MRYGTTLLGLLIVLAAAACGGGSSGGSGSTPTNPTPTTTTTPPTTNPPVQTTTITITASGVSPQRITVSPGTRVTFVNNDSTFHDMDSKPHPEHTECPALNIGPILVGASGTSQDLTTARVCGCHDHNQPTTTNFQGTIRIQ